MYMHAIYKIREFLSYKGFNLIKVYFTVHHSACICNDVGQYVTVNFSLGEKQQIVCPVVAYGRLKTIENFKELSLKVVAYGRWSLTRGGRLREVPSIVI